MARIVLQNKNRQTVRVFQVESEQVCLIYRQDSGRIELAANLDEYKENKIPHLVLVKSSTEALLKKEKALGDHGFLSGSLSIVSPSFEASEEEEHLQQSLKWSSIVHISFLSLFLMISFIASEFFVKDIEPVIINIPPPVELKKPEPPVTVKVSQEKIQPKVKKVTPVHNKKQVVKPRKTVRAKKPTPVRTSRSNKKTGSASVQNVGALSVLNSVKPRANSQGVNLDNVGGKSGSGSGRGQGGDFKKGVMGGSPGRLTQRGLIASSGGSGSAAQGSGGYGTNGVGGGQKGYGQISFAGKSAGMVEPLEDEIIHKGGLDRDQIDAVVRKNMGQIIYCYERGLQVKEGLKGRVTSQFVINGKGRVSLSKIQHTSLRHAGVESCIAGKIKGWKFPKPVGGVNVDVTYPFELRRVSQN